MHVDDLADAIVWILFNYDKKQFLNVGTGQDLSIKELAEKIKDSAMIARIMINLGMEESALGNEAKQMEYFTESLNIATKIKNTMVASYALLDIGCIWLERKDYKKAKEYLLKSLANAKELGYRSLQASLYVHLAYVFHAEKNYDKALDFYGYGYELAKNNKELLDIIRILNGMGDVMKQKKQYAKAIAYFEQALQENKNAEYKEELSTTYLSMSQTYADQKDFKNAYKFHITLGICLFANKRYCTVVRLAFFYACIGRSSLVSFAGAAGFAGTCTAVA